MVAISDYEHLFYVSPEVVRDQQEAIRVLTDIAHSHTHDGHLVSSNHLSDRLQIEVIISRDFQLTYTYRKSSRVRKDGGQNWHRTEDFTLLHGRCPNQRWCGNCTNFYVYKTGPGSGQDRWDCRDGRLNGPMSGPTHVKGCVHHRFPDEVRR